MAKSFANTIANARKVRAPAQSERARAITEEERKITQAEETGSGTFATPSQELARTTPQASTRPPLVEGEEDKIGFIRPTQPQPSAVETTEARVAAAGSTQPLIRQAAAAGVTNIEGQTRFDEETARQAVETELATQYEQAPAYAKQDDFFNYETAGQLRNKFENPVASNETYTNLLSAGFQMQEQLQSSFQEAFVDQGQVGKSSVGFLVNNGLVDPTTNQVSPKLANALVLQLIETIEDHINKRDESRRAAYNSSFAENPYAGFTREEPNNIKGELLNTDYVRGTLARGVVDKLLPNPNRQGKDISFGYGAAGTKIAPEEADYIDTLMWQAAKESGFLTDIRDGTDISYQFSGAAEDFFNATRDVMADIQPEKRIDISYSPATEGQALPGLSRIKGKKAGPVSLKSKLDENMALENAVKHNLGRMPIRVMEERFEFAADIVANIVEVDERGVITGLNNQADEGFFSREPWASMIGLDEKKWTKAYTKALKTHNGDKTMAKDQADGVLRREAKKIYQTMIDGDTRRDRVFYNKWFHASSVGRYFVRNTILNYQDSKLVRNFVGSPKRIIINLNSNQDKQVLDNWKYIVTKNLLLPEQTPANVKTEDMGWNAIMNEANKIINDPNNEIYQTWYLTGKRLSDLREASKDSIASLQQYNEILGPDFVKDFQDPGEWGYKYQSFLDFYDYVEAKKQAKTDPNAVVEFQAKAQTQHDGKQNGIAIQALQFGLLDSIDLIGGVYDTEDNIIPEGDIRAKFMNTLPRSIGQVFEEDPTKKKIWSAFQQAVMDSPDRKEITRAISRTPLMEVSYGKDPSFNEETVINFLESKHAPLLTDIVAASDINEYSRVDIIQDFNNLIARNLNESLDIAHQKMLQELGMFWSMMGKTPNYKGPLGTNIFLGSSQFEGTGQLVPVPTKEGLVMREVKVKRSTGSARSKRKKQRDAQSGEWKIAAPSRFGQEVANQLPVISIQQIDAAIMAKTINDVNQGRREPLFMLPVHDAIITDASSVQEYHARINKNFVNINKEYNLAKSIKKGYVDARATFARSIDQSESYTLSDESPHRALHSYLNAIVNQIKDAEVGDFARKPLTGRRPPRKGSREKLIAEAKTLGWREEGATLTGRELLELFRLTENHANIVNRLDRFVTTVKFTRPRALEKLREFVYQYN
jgi:hypothetical protein